jgi:phage tail-like protein
MPHAGPRPLIGARFLVDLGVGDPSSPDAGFSEVIFPTFRFAVDHAREPTLDAATDTERLVLRRGATGALDLYTWWDKARRGKAPQRRTVTVSLLDVELAVVLRWRFRNARPVSLTYSPLRAMESAIVFETIEIEYDRVEMRS